MAADIDWDMLRRRAVDVAANAYAPYSKLRVGAAGLVDDGRVVGGCNVENVSYGLSLCAECGVVCALHAGGSGRLVALSCVDADGTVLMPCGRCRQVLLEHGGPGLWIDHPGGPRRLGELLPEAFSLPTMPAGTAGGGGGQSDTSLPTMPAGTAGGGGGQSDTSLPTMPAGTAGGGSGQSDTSLP